MIKKIKTKYWRWKNMRWVHKNSAELKRKYGGQELLISHCKVVDAYPVIWGKDYSIVKPTFEDGDVNIIFVNQRLSNFYF